MRGISGRGALLPAVVLLVALVKAVHIVADEEEDSTKLYSYFCLDDPAQNLCLGISPAGDVPGPGELNRLQVKPRLRNEERATDAGKMRFDVNYANGTISLSLRPALLLGKRYDGNG